MTVRTVIAAVGLLASLAMAGCGKGADSGATSNPNAPGSPGTGNSPVSVAPRQPDSMAGGPSGVAGSLPHPGSSGGDTVSGVSGSGTDVPGSRSQTAQPGVGTTGGLGGSAGQGMTGSFPNPTQGAADASNQGVATDGSSNRTTSGAVGRR